MTICNCAASSTSTRCRSSSPRSLASNIGGTATLIGDPPNIMIGSAAGYSFVDFVLYDTPAALLSLAVMLALFYLLFGRKLHVDDAHKDALAGLDEREQIKNPVLLRQSVVMIALVVVGFMAHGSLGVESCVVALTAAGALMLISGERIEGRRSRTSSGPRSSSSPACSSSWAPSRRSASSACWRRP